MAAAATPAAPLVAPAPPCPTPISLPQGQRAYAALLELRAIVASEGYAMAALTLGRYRSDLLETFDNYIQDCAT